MGASPAVAPLAGSSSVLLSSARASEGASRSKQTSPHGSKTTVLQFGDLEVEEFGSALTVSPIVAVNDNRDHNSGLLLTVYGRDFAINRRENESA